MKMTSLWDCRKKGAKMLVKVMLVLCKNKDISPWPNCFKMQLSCGSQTWAYIRILWEACQNPHGWASTLTVSTLVGLEWGLWICVSKQVPRWCWYYQPRCHTWRTMAMELRWSEIFSLQLLLLPHPHSLSTHLYPERLLPAFLATLSCRAVWLQKYPAYLEHMELPLETDPNCVQAGGGG